MQGLLLSTSYLKKLQTFEVQFLLEFFIKLLSVELCICTFKVEVTFKLYCIFLHSSWSVLSSRTISGSPVSPVS